MKLPVAGQKKSIEQWSIAETQWVTCNHYLVGSMDVRQSKVESNRKTHCFSHRDVKSTLLLHAFVEGESHTAILC